MAQSTFVAFNDRMIQRYEGPYGWNKADPGGPTKYGVTCFDLAEHRGQKMDSMARWAPIVAAMTLAEADDIYLNKYAKALRYNDLPAGPDACMEDYGVNSGISRPILVARRMLSVPGPAKMDDALVAKIKATDSKWFIDNMCDERLRFMHAIRGGSAWAEFGRGWGARVADLRTYCEHLAVTGDHATAPAAPDLTAHAMPKAVHVPQTASKSTAAGAVAAGTASHASGLPLWSTAAIVAGVFVAGIAYEAYQDYAANKANNLVHI